MKKIVSIILVVCSIFYMASAAQPSDDVMPLYEHLTGMSASLEINSIGYANAQATATAEPGYNVRVTLELQQFENGWTTNSSYTSTGSGILGTKPYINRFVVHGTYQAKATAVVTDSYGNYVETQVATSYVVKY